MHITRKAFDRLVEEAIASLPEEFARWIDEVPIIVEDRPGKADIPAEEDDPLGLYVGPSLDDGRHSGELPPRIMIYREPLLEACHSQAELAEEVRKTLIHELGHYAGMEEEDLERLGYGPMEGDSVDWDVDDPDEDP